MNESAATHNRRSMSESPGSRRRCGRVIDGPGRARQCGPAWFCRVFHRVKWVVLFFELFPIFMTLVVVIVGTLLFLVNRRAHHDPMQEAHERHHQEIRQSVSTRAKTEPEPRGRSRRPSMNP